MGGSVVASWRARLERRTTTGARPRGRRRIVRVENRGLDAVHRDSVVSSARNVHHHRPVAMFHHSIGTVVGCFQRTAMPIAPDEYVGGIFHRCWHADVGFRVSCAWRRSHDGNVVTEIAESFGARRWKKLAGDGKGVAKRQFRR